MYIVGIDRPYYPAVYYVDTKEQALEKWEELLTEADEQGTCSSKVFIAEITNLTDIKTSY